MSITIREDAEIKKLDELSTNIIKMFIEKGVTKQEGISILSAILISSLEDDSDGVTFVGGKGFLVEVSAPGTWEKNHPEIAEEFFDAVEQLESSSDVDDVLNTIKECVGKPH